MALSRMFCVRRLVTRGEKEKEKDATCARFWRRGKNEEEGGLDQPFPSTDLVVCV